jgi:hypothetical protein
MAALGLGAAPDWSRRDAGRFTVLYLPGSDKQVDRIMPGLEPALDRVALALRASPPPHVTIIMTPDQRSFRELAGAPPWVSGVAFPERSLIYLRPLSGGEVRHSSLDAVIAHELTHVVLYGKTGGHHIPRWLDEGVAVFMADEPFYDRADALFNIGLTGSYIPFRYLEDAFPDSANASATAYAQSGDFIRFLIRKFGSEAFDHYLDLIGQGQDPDEALQAAFSTTLFPLENEWLKGVRWTYGLIPAVSGGALLWSALAFISVIAYLKKSARMREIRKSMAGDDYRARLQASRPQPREQGLEEDEDDFYEYVEEEDEEDDDLPPDDYSIH